VEEPPLIDVGHDHQAACWLAEAGDHHLPILDAIVPGTPIPPEVAAGTAAVAGDAAAGSAAAEDALESAETAAG
ncbi:MAG TPA: hypothetical protein VIZ22_11125, partial [Candidatus Limnocylindrales bacterium]